jgi:hypothetical protein
MVSGVALKPRTSEAALIRRVEEIRARLRASANRDKKDASRPEDDRLAQWGNWPNWYNWGNWGGRVPRRVGRWRWPGR